MLRYIKWSIWAYVVLLIIEGALRKWIIPSLSDPLTICRDPVVIVIYALAMAGGYVPQTRFLAVLAILAGASFVFAFLAGQTDLLITIYGMRTNYLHVPLIWVMAEVLDRKDVERLGLFFLLSAIPMVYIMGKQFYAPVNDFLNKGVGDSEEGQIYGAMGRIRPPGTFPFITGPMVYFPVVTAFLLHRIMAERRFWWLALTGLAGIASLVAIFLSISRGTALASLGVLAVFGFCLLRTGVINTAAIRFAITAAVVMIGLSFLPVFDEARAAFMDRWNTAALESEGRGWGSLAGRVLGVLFVPFEYAAQAEIFGAGIGLGSSFASKRLTGVQGFLLAEDAWGNTFLELGPALGAAFILFRVWIGVYLLAGAWKALAERRDMLPLLIWAAAVPTIVLHQWGPPTLLGFAVVGGGLCLAAIRNPPEQAVAPVDEEDDDTDDDGEEDEDVDERTEEEAPEPISEFEAQRRRMRGL